jgi:hypothetical protein
MEFVNALADVVTSLWMHSTITDFAGHVTVIVAVVPPVLLDVPDVALTGLAI